LNGGYISNGLESDHNIFDWLIFIMT